MFMFLFFGVLLLIPSWPFFIAFGYLLIGFMNTFFLGRSNQDIFFTACLPVRKTDIARVRVLSIAAFELMQLIAAIPFAYLNTLVNPTGNQAGMNPNFAFFGFVLAMYSFFNFVFLPWFYRTGYKVGVPLLFGSLAFMFTGAAIETVIHSVPALLDTIGAIGAGHLGSQLIVLTAGLVCFVGLTWLACRRSAKNFDRVDL
jgi:hypothetical protein